MGYYRHVFAADLNNENSTKYTFDEAGPKTGWMYFKYAASFAGDLDFNNADIFYKKALGGFDRELQARVIFQLASVEQGNFYADVSSSFPDGFYTLTYLGFGRGFSQEPSEEDKKLAKLKNLKYRNSFQLLKDQFRDTKAVAEMRASCSYFASFMMR